MNSTAIFLTIAALCSLLVLQARSDSRPAPRFTCPGHQRPVCVGGDNDYVTTLRNECVFASLAAEERLVRKILHRGPCKGFSEQSKWSGWERDVDDIPANYEAYKLKYPDSKY